MEAIGDKIGEQGMEMVAGGAGKKPHPYCHLPCLLPDFYPAQDEHLQHHAGDHPAGRGDGGALYTKAGGHCLQADARYHRGSGAWIPPCLPSADPEAGLQLSLAQDVSWN